MSKVKCLKCGEELESKSVHDFQQCMCKNQTFVDGGDQYCRIGGADMNFVQVILPSKVKTDEDFEDHPWDLLPG